MSTPDRHFIVSKIGQRGIPTVEIREVEPGSCAYFLSRAEAWKRANDLGQAVNIRGGSKHGYLPIFFTGLDMNRTQVGTAANNVAPQAELTKPCENAKAVTEMAETAKAVATALETPAEYKWLNQQNLDGKLNTFLASLHEQLSRKGSLSDKQRECLRNAMQKAEKAEAKDEPKEDTTGVPAGRYAIERDGEIKFYKIEKGKDGSRWAGMTFVKVQASDDTFPVRNRIEREDILNHIADDIPAAMALYGKEIGRCGHCHKVLTSEWRKKGIGPVCAGKMGW